MKIGELRKMLNEAENQSQWLKEITTNADPEAIITQQLPLALATINHTAKIIDKLVEIIQDSEVN